MDSTDLYDSIDGPDSCILLHSHTAAGSAKWRVQPENLNLIAAAPELYEALAHAIQYEYGDDAPTKRTPKPRWVAKGQKALAKARGETE